MIITDKSQIAQKLDTFKPTDSGARATHQDPTGRIPSNCQEWVERGTICDAKAAIFYVFTDDEILKCADSTDIYNLMDIDHVSRLEIETTAEIKERLEYLRHEILAERISYGEIAELQFLADHIEPDDVLLLQWAGVDENKEELPAAVRLPFKEWTLEGDLVMSRHGCAASCATGEIAQLCHAAPDLLEACLAAAVTIELQASLLKQCGAAVGRGLTNQKLEAAILKAGAELPFVETTL